MAASQAESAIGTQFLRKEGASYVEVGEVRTVTGPTKSRDELDRTHLMSTSGYKEFGPSFRDPGTVVLNMAFTRAAFDTLNGDFETDDLQDYKLTYADTDTTEQTFEGFVRNVELRADRYSDIMMDVTVRISGPVTVAT